MAEYFHNPDDLKAWVKSHESYDTAARDLLSIIDNESDMYQGNNDEQDIVQTCQSIFESDSAEMNASEILFGVLAKHKITKLNKQAKMNKSAQNESRQRNNWSSGQRNKWNRCVDGYNDGTPWRVSRDEYYDFTHYATDEIRFDEDPQHIYSGEALWRTYVMDKFYRDYKDKDGKVVGGYINDRFHVFPTAGTPANPDAPRDGGNQMELADGERTRQPRSHEYSMERRLEEARGNKMKSITLAKSFDKVVKVASNSKDNLDEAGKDRVFNMFKDVVEMRTAGIDYETMITAVSDHYNASILGVSQIDGIAKKLIAKHQGIGYEATVKKASTLAEVLQNSVNSNIQIIDPNGAKAVMVGANNAQTDLIQGTMVVAVPGMQNVFEITDHPLNAGLVGSRVSFENMDFEVGSQPLVQEAADELGLNEKEVAKIESAITEQNPDAANGDNASEGFDVTQL